MTLLTTWKADDPDTVVVRTSDPAAVATELDRLGIHFEQWPTRELADGASADEILAAYQPEIDRLVTEGGYTVVDVAQLHPSDDPSWPDTAAAARRKFLAEHTHAEDEVRFFVAGAGIFYLHVVDPDGTDPGETDIVLAVLCESGDLISVPALTTHWFDMGTRPDFTAIRLFLDPDGWVGTFTGDPIAESFADFDTLAATR